MSVFPVEQEQVRELIPAEDFHLIAKKGGKNRQSDRARTQKTYKAVEVSAVRILLCVSLEEDRRILLRISLLLLSQVTLSFRQQGADSVVST